MGLITPWNFPIAIPAWKIAPALAFGNTVVFKPAQWTPGCAWVLTDILAAAGVPAGVFNLVMGSGSIVGDTLVNRVNHTDKIAPWTFGLSALMENLVRRGLLAQ